MRDGDVQHTQSQTHSVQASYHQDHQEIWNGVVLGNAVLPSGMRITNPSFLEDTLQDSKVSQ